MKGDKKLNEFSLHVMVEWKLNGKPVKTLNGCVAEGTPEDILKWCLKQLKRRVRIAHCDTIGAGTVLLESTHRTVALILDPPPDCEDCPAKPLLETMERFKDSRRWECNFKSCFHGLGLSGTDRCAGFGQPREKNCTEYVEETEQLKKWRLTEILFRKF